MRLHFYWIGSWLLVRELEDGSLLEIRRLFIGDYYDCFFLLLRLNAEYVFIVDLVIESGEVWVGQVIVHFQVLHLLFGGISEVKDKLEALLWNDLANYAHLHFVILQQNVLLLQTAPAQPDEHLLVVGLQLKIQVLVVVEPELFVIGVNLHIVGCGLCWRLHLHLPAFGKLFAAIIDKVIFALPDLFQFALISFELLP